ncbi:MAG: uracil-DNA glycosylase, partial [Candidatus Methylomirabilis sp.]
VRTEKLTIFPLLHPAAALHQGNLMEPLREDFLKLKAFLDQAQRPEPAPQPPSAPSEPQRTQMDLFGA